MGPEQFLQRPRTMKLLALLFLAAVAYAEPEAKAEAEADPYLLYAGYYGHPCGYGYGGYYGYPYGGYRYLWKRDAGEEQPAAEGPNAEADPQLLYANYYHHGLTYSPYYYTPSVYHHTYAAPVTYAAATVAAPYRYYANSAGVVHAVAKREAEAAPESDAQWGYYGYPGWGRRYYGWGSPFGYRRWWY